MASIRNLSQIESAYGTPTALAVRHIVFERARDFCMKESGIVTRSGEHIVFLIDRRMPEEQESAFAARSDAGFVEAIIAALGDAPVLASTGSIRAAICATIPASNDKPFDVDTADPGEARMGTQAWRTRYSLDMQIADDLLGALEACELCFRYEKVCHAMDTDTVTYYEALLCRTRKGVPVSVGRRVPVLERLGLVGRLDRWVVLSTIDTLREYPGISLGCNVSSQSAKLDGWWCAIMETLASEPAVAARLVIELTGSAPLTDIDRVREFARALQQLGCRVALDDIGVGLSSVRSLVELGVDIAKVDRGDLHVAHSSADARLRLGALIRLAGACASHVVVENVENEDDLALCVACGAHWVQGYAFEPVFASGFPRVAPDHASD